MLDTMTMTKLMGGLCGSFLVFLLGGFFAEFIYHEHHGDDHHQAYTIDTGEDDAAAEVVEVAFADVYATADPSAGEGEFRACRACHQMDPGANGAGPYLAGIVGRPVEGADGFAYSGALSAATDAWTPEALNAFLENPSGYAAGTSMSFNGIRDVEDRANLIAWLAENG
ncbi:MAG: cytochrome c family protein [Pseudomonadota bacterium]